MMHARTAAAVAAFSLAQPLRPLCAPRSSPRVYACAASAPARAAHAATTHRVRLLACDMDGTILDSASQIPPRNVSAVARLLSETDVLFVPATGKSRVGALRGMGDLGDLLRTRHPLGVPGVFAQGLLVYGARGEVLYEDGLEDGLAARVAEVAERFDLSLIAYSRDDILSAKRTSFTDLLPSYHEPEVTVAGGWERVIGTRVLNKFIFMADPARIDEVRPHVAIALGEHAVLTQAQGNMLEVLPAGTSKGNGLLRLLDDWRIKPSEVMAIGDAENDLEMLGMVGVSCAVSNALPSVKTVAKFTDLPSNDEAGVAAAIDRFILGL